MSKVVAKLDNCLSFLLFYWNIKYYNLSIVILSSRECKVQHIPTHQQNQQTLKKNSQKDSMMSKSFCPHSQHLNFQQILLIKPRSHISPHPLANHEKTKNNRLLSHKILGFS